VKKLLLAPDAAWTATVIAGGGAAMAAGASAAAHAAEASETMSLEGGLIPGATARLPASPSTPYRQIRYN
jgi:hypothetical protein